MADINAYECEDCGYRGQEKDFPNVRDPELRFEPGDTWTDKECSKCGALAFPVWEWEITNSLDGNTTFTVEGCSYRDAALAALSELNWSVSASPVDPED